MSAKWTMMAVSRSTPLSDWLSGSISVALILPVTYTALPFWQQLEFSNNHIFSRLGYLSCNSKVSFPIIVLVHALASE